MAISETNGRDRQTDRQTDGRTPDRYITLSATRAVNVLTVMRLRLPNLQGCDFEKFDLSSITYTN